MVKDKLNKNELVFDTDNKVQIKSASEILKQMRNKMRKYVIGQDEFIDLTIIAFLAQEGILVEGSPGIAKTLVLRLWAKLTSCSYYKIQFQPDTKVYELVGSIDMKYWRETGRIKYLLDKGAASEVLIIDEPNQGPSDLMSALRQIVQEREYQGEKVPLIFYCAALNPSDEKKLSPADLDRFSIAIHIQGNIARLRSKNIIQILNLDEFTDPFYEVKPMLTRENVQEILDLVKSVNVPGYIYDTILTIVSSVQEESTVEISDRVLIKVKRLLKASAVYDGRAEVNLSDIEKIMYYALRKRTDIKDDLLRSFINAAIKISEIKLLAAANEDVSNQIRVLQSLTDTYKPQSYISRKYSALKSDLKARNVITS